MQKKIRKNSKIKNLFNKMPISRKMTLIYTCVFFLIMFAASIFMLVNSWVNYSKASKSEINEVFDLVEDYITSGGVVSTRAVNSLISNEYIEVKVLNKNGEPLKADEPNDLPDNNGVPEIGGGNVPRNNGINAPKNNGTNVHRTNGTNTPKDNDTSTSKDNAAVPPPVVKSLEHIDEEHQRFDIEMIMDAPYMVAKKSITYNEHTYIVEVYRQYSKEYEIMKTVYVVFLLENLFAIIIAFVVSKFITNKILKPVRDITDMAEQISVEDLSKRIEVPAADDEMRKLAVTFNEMIERLEISFERQNQFISDASHELRTPISVIQGYINLIDRWGKSDEAILEESISSIKSETEHMTNIIKQLLFLAKNDINGQQINIEELNAAFIVSEIEKEIQVLDVNTKFSYNISDDVVIYGDYHLIKQLIWIFVENAVKYSGDKESKINVNVYTKDDNTCIEIQDNGIGIAEEDAKHIFERFYRSDKSRNKGIAGIGLGLSIARWIVDRHKGSIKVDSVLGEGTTFTIVLPCEKK